MAKSNYGSVNLKTGKITVNKSMNKSGMEYMDTVTHEMAHVSSPEMSERAIIKKTQGLRESLLAII